jgi:hypothetical protein
MDEFKGILLLGDEYDQVARLRPAILVVLPLGVAAAAWGFTKEDWWSALGIGVLVQFSLVLILGFVARTLGRRAEYSKNWPLFEERVLDESTGQRLTVPGEGSMPANQWLRQSDVTHSPEQKTLWYEAVHTVTGIDLTKTIDSEHHEYQAIADAVQQLKRRLPAAASKTVVAKQEAEYGFMRNLWALRYTWLLTSVAGLTICIVGHWRGHFSSVPAAVEFVLIVAAGRLVFELMRDKDSAVQIAAERYSQTLLCATLDRADELSEKKAKDAQPTPAAKSSKASLQDAEEPAY